MALREVIRIDEEKCDGCGECVISCAEGAIAIIDGKARLVGELYCDGLGACLGHCPQGAITTETREAEAFDEAKTRVRLEKLRARKAEPTPIPVLSALPQCPGSMPRSLGHRAPALSNGDGLADRAVPSELMNWPVQMALVSPAAPDFQGADLLLVADCVPFACADFHRRFLRGKPVIIGCPKLDQAERYVQKLAEILRAAEPASLTVVHMEVPCCSGLTRIAEYAREIAGSTLPLTDVTVGIGGEVKETREAPAPAARA
jgi:Pyruvate/2-oxoacid:ferredoxin oxidoreductase delta subunit